MAMAAIVGSLPLTKFSSLSLNSTTFTPPSPHPCRRSLQLLCQWKAKEIVTARKRIVAMADTTPPLFQDDPAEEEEEGIVEEDDEENDEEEEEEYGYGYPDEDDEQGGGKWSKRTTAAYESLYGSATGEERVEGRTDTTAKIDDEFEEAVVHVRRVCKVLKGGQRISFRAVVVVGDRKGRVGVGKGKALEIMDAFRKGALKARKSLIRVPITSGRTFPHRADGKYCGALVMIRPGVPGCGLRAGQTVRTVLELAGYENALGKQLRSRNHLNNARATIVALSQLRTLKQVSERRGIPVEQLMKW